MFYVLKRMFECQLLHHQKRHHHLPLDLWGGCSEQRKSLSWQTMIINASIRALLAVTTLTIEPMMFLWSVAGGMAKVSTDQMILYKVPVSDVERIIIVKIELTRTFQDMSRVQQLC